VLLIELVNQTSACLLSLLGHRSLVRLSRVLGAQFLSPVHLTDHVTVRAGIDEADDIFARAHGQVIAGDTIAATAVVEVVFDA
jgi:acyl-CoA thioesterase FadM